MPIIRETEYFALFKHHRKRVFEVIPRKQQYVAMSSPPLGLSEVSKLFECSSEDFNRICRSLCTVRRDQQDEDIVDSAPVIMPNKPTQWEKIKAAQERKKQKSNPPNPNNNNGQ